MKLLHSFHRMFILNILYDCVNCLVFGCPSRALRMIDEDPALSILLEQFNDILLLSPWGDARNRNCCGRIGVFENGAVFGLDKGVLHD